MVHLEYDGRIQVLWRPNGQTAPTEVSTHRRSSEQLPKKPAAEIPTEAHASSPSIPRYCPSPLIFWLYNLNKSPHTQKKPKRQLSCHLLSDLYLDFLQDQNCQASGCPCEPDSRTVCIYDFSRNRFTLACPRGHRFNVFNEQLDFKSCTTHQKP